MAVGAFATDGFAADGFSATGAGTGDGATGGFETAAALEFDSPTCNTRASPAVSSREGEGLLRSITTRATGGSV